jgi:hypothetical protein
MSGIKFVGSLRLVDREMDGQMEQLLLYFSSLFKLLVAMWGMLLMKG